MIDRIYHFWPYQGRPKVQKTSLDNLGYNLLLTRKFEQCFTYSRSKNYHIKLTSMRFWRYPEPHVDQSTCAPKVQKYSLLSNTLVFRKFGLQLNISFLKIFPEQFGIIRHAKVTSVKSFSGYQKFCVLKSIVLQWLLLSCN